MVASEPNPYQLVVHLATGETATIDLDEQGWSERFSAFMRGHARWVLIPQTPAWPTLFLEVQDGEQPYYTSRFIGAFGTAGGNGTRAYGLGIRGGRSLWALEGGIVCSDEDVYVMGELLVAQKPPLRPDEEEPE